MAKSLCRACGETFKSVAGFDKHRTGSYGEAIYAEGDVKRKNPIGQGPSTRRCMTVAEMVSIGMSKNAQGWWITTTYDESAHTEEDAAESAV